MTDERKDGGPAFPHDNQELGDRHRVAQPGMSLRDWFAGQAMASIMQDRAIWDSTPDEELDVARRMYRWSDAMLAARKSES